MTMNERFIITGLGKIVEITVKSKDIHNKKTKYSLFELNMSPVHIITAGINETNLLIYSKVIYFLWVKLCNSMSASLLKRLNRSKYSKEQTK